MRFSLQGDPKGDPVEADTRKSFVRRYGSLNGLATGGTSLVAGGYRLGAGLGSSLACARPARYSSAGTLKPDWIVKTVDRSSMSDRSRALPGTVSAGVRSGSRSLIQGTSTAAPRVARQLAETFVIAEESAVRQAEESDCRTLLTGFEPQAREQADSNDSCGREDDAGLIKARLGAVLVPPYWQSGIEPNEDDQRAIAATREH